MKASLHPIADKYLNRLNVNDRDRIDDAIEGLEKEPPEGDIKPLKRQPGFFRLRVGGYRLLLDDERGSRESLLSHDRARRNKKGFNTPRLCRGKAP